MGTNSYERRWLIEFLNDPKSAFSELCDQLKRLEALGRKLAGRRDQQHAAELKKVKQQKDGLAAAIECEAIDARFKEYIRQSEPEGF